MSIDAKVADAAECMPEQFDADNLRNVVRDPVRSAVVRQIHVIQAYRVVEERPFCEEERYARG